MKWSFKDFQMIGTVTIIDYTQANFIFCRISPGLGILALANSCFLAATGI